VRCWVVTADAHCRSIAFLETTLPPDWKNASAPAELRTIGDMWVNSIQSLALAVPSALLPDVLVERNVLINPLHPRFATVTWTIEDFAYDVRLLR